MYTGLPRHSFHFAPLLDNTMLRIKRHVIASKGSQWDEKSRQGDVATSFLFGKGLNPQKKRHRNNQVPMTLLTRDGVKHNHKTRGRPGTHISGRPSVSDLDSVSADHRPPAAVVRRNTKVAFYLLTVCPGDADIYAIPGRTVIPDDVGTFIAGDVAHQYLELRPVIDNLRPSLG